MRDKIIVIGGKGSAVVIAEQIYSTQTTTGEAEFLGFAFDDEAFYPEISGFPVLSKTREVYAKYEKYPDVKFIFSMYRSDLHKERVAVRDSYGIPPERWATFIHHTAYVAGSSQLGYGNVILANSVVNSNVKMGNFNTIQSSVLIGHDNIIGNNNYFTGHCAIGSNNNIGSDCFFGLNTSVNNYINIGDNVFCGMASNVIKSIDDNVMVYGNPARPVERKIKPL